MQNATHDATNHKYHRGLDELRDKVSQAAGRGHRRGSGTQYQQLARDESEADQSLGLELGIGGMGGLRLSALHEPDCDDVV